MAGLTISGNKKQAVVLIWLLATTILSAYGLLGPKEIQVALTTSQIIEALKTAPPEEIAGLLQVVLNSSYSLLSKPCSALIEKVGSYTCLGNGANAKLMAYSTNASQIINWATGNLTAGRTWQESILFKGSFDIETTLTIPSYTILDLRQAKLMLNNSANTNMMKANTADYITILGGIIDGNKANQAGYSEIIKLTNVRHFRIYDSTIQNATNGLVFYLDNSVEDEYTIDNIVDGVYFTENNVCDLGTDGYITTKRINDIKIINCEFRNSTGVSGHKANNIIFRGNTWFNVTRAIAFTATSKLRIIANNFDTVSNNEGAINIDTYVMADECDDVAIIENTIKNSVWGIKFNMGLAHLKDCRIKFNMLRDNSQTDILIEGVNQAQGKCVVTDNTVDSNNDISVSALSGTIKVERNEGYITENCITFSSISNGTYVPHGCAGTPDYVTITLSTSGYGWYGTKNSTHCQLYFSVATASGTARFEYIP